MNRRKPGNLFLFKSERLDLKTLSTSDNSGRSRFINGRKRSLLPYGNQHEYQDLIVRFYCLCSGGETGTAFLNFCFCLFMVPEIIR